jgi:hypothetical protein
MAIVLSGCIKTAPYISKIDVTVYGGSIQQAVISNVDENQMVTNADARTITTNANPGFISDAAQTNNLAACATNVPSSFQIAKRKKHNVGALAKGKKAEITTTKSISEFLTDEILYNLVSYKDFYENKNGNGLPSFLIPASTSGESLSLFTSKSTEAKWSLIPVDDAGQLERIYLIYKSEFLEVTTNDLELIFPLPSIVDTAGYPRLDYFARTNEDGLVELDTQGKPIFMMKTKVQKQTHSVSDIPGALQEVTKTATPIRTDGTTTSTNSSLERVNGWFSFTEPQDNSTSSRMGPYLGHYIWITNLQNFVKFELLVLGKTNAVSN